MFKSKHWIHWAMLIVMIFSLSSTATAQSEVDETAVYMVHSVFDVETRSAIAATGALILEVGHDYVLVEATLQEKNFIQKKLGLDVAQPEGLEAEMLAFPPADSAYHDYAEMVAELNQAAADHPSIFSLFSLGTSYQGREIWAARSQITSALMKPNLRCFSPIINMRANISLWKWRFIHLGYSRTNMAPTSRSPIWLIAAKSGWSSI